MRFIPAGAGNGRRPSTHVQQSTVHPRGCGERPPPFDGCSQITGSSPRVRGTGAFEATIINMGRFIPAGAGNGLLVGILADPQPVHPRGCGERKTFKYKMFCFTGSSPRVRGTDQASGNYFGAGRFIPAGAGNGDFLLLRVKDLSVHPRGCGERSKTLWPSKVTNGSSPRVRGTVGRGPAVRRPSRFIPAGAGNG